MPVSTADFRNGLKIELDGEPYTIIEFQHVKPGKGPAFVRTKIKSLRTGNVLDRTFRSSEKAEIPDLEEKTMQYLYAADKDRIRSFYQSIIATSVLDVNLRNAPCTSSRQL